MSAGLEFTLVCHSLEHEGERREGGETRKRRRERREEGREKGREEGGGEEEKERGEEGKMKEGG